MWNSTQRANLLRQLHALNRHFVLQLVSEAEIKVASPALGQQLRALDPAALHEICATPFTLYHLPFGNSTYWRETAELSAQSARAERGFEPQPQSATHLAQLTLYFAWHVACTDAAAARLFFGMSTDTLEFFRQADVATLSALVVEAAQVLQPRWHNNPYFWPELIRAATTDRVCLHAARLLGAQLLAAELHGEHFQHCVARRPRAARVRRAAVEHTVLAGVPIEQQVPAAVPL